MLNCHAHLQSPFDSIYEWPLPPLSSWNPIASGASGISCFALRALPLSSASVADCPPSPLALALEGETAISVVFRTTDSNLDPHPSSTKDGNDCYQCVAGASNEKKRANLLLSLVALLALNVELVFLVRRVLAVWVLVCLDLVVLGPCPDRDGEWTCDLWACAEEGLSEGRGAGEAAGEGEEVG